MNRFKEMMKDSSFARGSFFIVFNAVLLCILFSAIKNLGAISSGAVNIINSLIGAFSPLFIGLVLAYLLNPLSELIDSKVVNRLIRIPDDPAKAERRLNLSHLISVILTFIIVIAAVVAILYSFTVMLIGKVVFTNISDLIQNFITGITRHEETFRYWISNNIPDGFISEKLSTLLATFTAWISDNINVASIVAFFANVGGSILDVILGIIVAIYLMKDKQFFLRLWRKFLHLVLPQKANGILTETLSEINGVLSKFIRGALLDALIIAILSSIGLSIMGLEAAVFIGVFAGIANIIPYFGPVLGMVPAFLMGLCTEGFWHGVIAVIILFVIQQIDANIIYPRVVGSSTGLHPLFVLLAISAFGYFGGIFGMLLAVPIAGIIQVFILKWANSKENKLADRAAKKVSETPDSTSN